MASNYDYAILVLTPDDVLLKREINQMTARDNVLFELGFFIGKLGRDKTFIIASSDVTLPSDLAGITVFRFDLTEQPNIIAGMGPACTAVESVMGLL